MQCDDCAVDHLFMCRNNGVHLCLNRAYLTRCDGLIHCGNLADELISEGPNCVDDPSMFTCKKNGLEICLKKSHYQCSGYPDCDGYSNTLAHCDNCIADNLFKWVRKHLLLNDGK